MFGQRLQQLRVNAGLTQSELAERVGVSLAKVQEWEAYGGEPGSGTMTKLAVVLDIPEEELATGLAEAHEIREKQVVSTPRERP